MTLTPSYWDSTHRLLRSLRAWMSWRDMLSFWRVSVVLYFHICGIFTNFIGSMFSSSQWNYSYLCYLIIQLICLLNSAFKNSDALWGLPRWPSGKKKSTCQCRRCMRCGFYPWVSKMPWSRKQQSAKLFSCLDNFMDRGRRLAAFTKSRTQLNTCTCVYALFEALQIEKSRRNTSNFQPLLAKQIGAHTVPLEGEFIINKSMGL